MSTNARVRGLYAIADTALLGPAHLVQAVEQALDGGARIIQYRDKTTDAARRLEEARALAGLCRRHGALFLVNDDVALALESGAEGVHLGREDAAPQSARARLGAAAIIGVSCYNELSRATAAVAHGGDYVAFGSFFPSATKPQAVRAPVALLQEARRALTVPIVAIGGITPENGAALIAAGADALAVIEGVFRQPDIRAAAERYARLFPSEHQSP